MTRIAKINIRNILGVTELEFEAGAYNELRGRNGSGKTSVLSAIKSTLERGHDATLLRTGETEGESVLVLDDGRTIAKKIRGDKSTAEVRDADGKKLPRPASIIDQLADLISANPVDFLRAPARMRVQVLLESMPIEIDTEYLQQIVGNDISQIRAENAIDLIDTLRSEIYASRTATNRTLKEKNASIIQLSESLPDGSGNGEAPDKAGLMDQVDAAAQARDAEFARIDKKLAGIVEDAEARMQAIRDEVAKTKELASAQRERVQKKYVQQTGDIRERIAVIDEASRQAAQHDRTRQMIESMHEQSMRMQAESDDYTASLEQIDAYREKLLSELPIPGLVVQDGQIYREGVQFDRLNTAQQVEIAVEIARLRAGDLGIICVDGLELLDSERYEEFKKRAIDSGLQMFVSRVENSDFNIATE